MSEKCFGDYAHKNFCYNTERQQKRNCVRQSQCFKRASGKLYFYGKNTKRKCELCGKQTCSYEVEDVQCGSIQVNLYVPSLTKTLETHVEWLEHPICPKCFVERNQLIKVPKEWDRFCGFEAKP